MGPITSEQVLAAILAGWCDDDLENIQECLNVRRGKMFADEGDVGRARLGRDETNKPLLAGDRVIVNNRATPIYLRGAKGTVVGKYGKKVRVEFDRTTNAKRYGGQTVPVPPTMLTRLGDAQ